ncbi:TonB-dependent receptor [Sphingomonas sp. CL5.1]|nr:TonB-dependent receptor [Sphingomonas sp. CL5.1]
MRFRFLLSSVSLLTVIPYAPAFAQDSHAPAEKGVDGTHSAVGDGTGLSDIVVTAQKREGRLQETPLAISAVDSATIDRRQVLSVQDLPALAPGVSVAQHAGYNRLFIRGIGLTSISNGQDPSVAFQVDGVVIGRPSAQLASFFDIERIEVLRGPQGTLYGRNATGGTVNLITRKPTEALSGYLDVGYGNYNSVDIDGAISGALDKAGDLRARLAFQRITHDGYGRDVTLNTPIDDQNSWAVRGTVEADPTDKIQITVSADYAKEDDHNYAFHGFGPYRADVPLPGLLMGGTLLANSRDIASEVNTTNKREFWGLAGTIKIDLGNGFSLQSITGYRHSHRGNITDPETTSYPVFSPVNTVETARQFSEELQVNYSSNRLKAVGGLFYYDEDLFAMLDLKWLLLGSQLGFPNAAYQEKGTVGIKSYAAYTEWTWEALDHVHFTVGLRYSDERRKSLGTLTIFNFLPPPNGANSVIPINQKKNWDAFTPKFGIDYKPNDNVMLYASATKGFKSGVLLAGNPNPPVDPEYIWAYEGGIKTTLLDRRLQLNSSVFHYDYTNLQVNQIVGNSIITKNAAAAKITGAELEMRAAPARGINLDASVTYLDAKFTSFTSTNPAYPAGPSVDLAGRRLVNAPKWALNAGAEVELPVGLPGSLSLRGDMAYTSKVYFTEFNDAALSQKAVAIFDASLRYEDAGNHWTASLFVKNLTNQMVLSNKFVAAGLTGYAINGGFKPPRLYGVRLGYKF